MVEKGIKSKYADNQWILGDVNSIVRILESCETRFEQTDFLVLGDLLVLALCWHTGSDLGRIGHNRCCWVSGLVLEMSSDHEKKRRLKSDGIR